MPPDAVFRAVTFGPDGRLYAAGLHEWRRGALFTSTDGVAWDVRPQADGLGFVDVSAVGPAALLASKPFAEGGGIVRSDDGGRTWSR